MKYKMSTYLYAATESSLSVPPSLTSSVSLLVNSYSETGIIVILFVLFTFTGCYLTILCYNTVTRGKVWFTYTQGLLDW